MILFSRAGLVACVLLVATLGAGGCGHKIGDSCGTSADCDPSAGTRTCDLSEPGGYCILLGCDARSCPSDSVCARFFPEPPLLDTTKGCDPVASAVAGACAGVANGVCCDADEVCLKYVNPDPTSSLFPAGGACVRTALEKRACVASCGSNGDCRGGYECRAVSSCGAIPLTLDPTSTPQFCAPMPPPIDGGTCSLY
jgi:hypothetical protein